MDPARVEYFMALALKQAEKAFQKREAPVGALIVYEGCVLARAYNQRERLQDPTAHAEVIALKKAAKKLGTWRLSECDLFVTLEPCPMCAGAIVQARVRKVYFGAYDAKAGAVGSVVDLFHGQKFNHQVKYEGGILKEECSHLLKNFFLMLRKEKQQQFRRDG